MKFGEKNVISAKSGGILSYLYFFDAKAIDETKASDFDEVVRSEAKYDGVLLAR